MVGEIYCKVQLPEEWVQRLTEELEEEIVERQATAADMRVALTHRIAELADERRKLLRAYYANALPVELLKEEQDRISSQEESAQAELAATEADPGEWQEALKLAIRLAGSCHAAYLKARPKVRARFNQAVLQAVYIRDRQVQRAEFTEVFDALFSRPSSNRRAVVGPDGFEPSASPLSGVRSNRAELWAPQVANTTRRHRDYLARLYPFRPKPITMSSFGLAPTT